MINITIPTIIESTIMYGIVHGIWIVIKKVYASAEDKARVERKRLHKHIRVHRESDHKGHFATCRHPECVPIRHF